jgi:hypothetical protein
MMYVRQANLDALCGGSNQYSSLNFHNPDNIITGVLPAGLHRS